MILVLIVLYSTLSNASHSGEKIPLAANLQSDGKLQQKTGKVILLYVSAPHCAFCKRLEKEVLLPLIHSGEYQNKIILRKINWRSDTPVIDFKGVSKRPSEILKPYGIQITPTLLFLDANGRPVIERLLGYRGGEFYWYYFDVAIDKANKLIAAGN